MATNVVQFSAASRKRDRDHINRKQREGHVIHESKESFDGGDGLPPIVVQVILKTQDDVFEEQKVVLKEKPVIGFWTTVIAILTLGFWLSG